VSHRWAVIGQHVRDDYRDKLGDNRRFPGIQVDCITPPIVRMYGGWVLPGTERPVISAKSLLMADESGEFSS